MRQGQRLPALQGCSSSFAGCSVLGQHERVCRALRFQTDRGHVTFARDGRVESVQNGQRISVRLAIGASHDREKANPMKDPGIPDAENPNRTVSKYLGVDTFS